MQHRKYIYSIMAIVLISSCENIDPKLETKNINIIDTIETTLQNKKDHWILSTDSIWKLRVYPMVGDLYDKSTGAFRASFDKITSEPMHFYCVELRLLDTDKSTDGVMPSKFPILPMASSSGYRALLIYNEEFTVYSPLESIQEESHIDKSIRFAFSIHSFDTFTNSVEITLTHIGGDNYNNLLASPDKYPNGYPIFQVTDLHNLIMPFDTILYDKNAPLADESWFKKKDLKEFLPKKKRKMSYTLSISENYYDVEDVIYQVVLMRIIVDTGVFTERAAPFIIKKKRQIII